MMDSQSELGQSHNNQEIKKNELLAGLDRRVTTIVTFKDLIDSTSSDDAPESIENTLDNFLVQTRAQFPQDTVNNFTKLCELEGKVKNVEDEDESYWEIFDEIDSLKKIQDVAFLYKLEQMSQNLKQKNQQIAVFRHDRDALEAFVQGILSRNSQTLDFGAVNSIDFTAFSTSVVVSPNHYRTILGRSNGLHYSNTPINFIRERSGYQSTIDHENIHNILDGIDIQHTHNPYHSLKQAFMRYETDDNEGLSRLIRKQHIVKRYSPTWLVNQLQEEFLAHVQNLEAGGFISDNNRSHMMGLFTIQEFAKIDSFGTYSEFFSSAGSHARGISTLLENFAEVTDEEDLKEFCTSLKRGFQDLYTKTVKDMENGLGIAQRVGSEAHLSAHSLLYLLNPNQYHHIPTFLKYKYGEERVAQAVASRDMVRKFSFEPEILHSFLSKFEENGNFLADIDRLSIEGMLENFDIWDYDVILTDENYQQYKDLLSEVGESIKIDMTKYEDRLETSLLENKYFYLIKNDLSQQFVNLSEIYPTLDENRKELFITMLEAYLTSHLKEDLNEDELEKLETEGLKAFPFWKVIKQMGIAGHVEEKLGGL